MQTNSILEVALAAVLTAAGCATSPPPGGRTVGTDYERSLDLRVFGLRRSYRVHLPPAHDGRRALPLVVAVHGAFSSPSQFASRTGFDRIADEAGFVVVYPAGFAPPLRHWNSGHCCGVVRALGIDDVEFLDAVMADARGHLVVDPSRIYLVGHSNGGMLTHRFVAERPGRVAAAAVVAGTIGGRPSSDEPAWEVPRAEAPVPMLILHGRLDETVAYEGGPDERSRSGRTWISAARSARFWSEHAGCAVQPRREVLHDGRVTRDVWDSAAGCRVEFHTIEGWGHEWPGGTRTGALEPDHPLHGFDATRAIWHFFRRSPELVVAGARGVD